MAWESLSIAVVSMVWGADVRPPSLTNDDLEILKTNQIGPEKPSKRIQYCDRMKNVIELVQRVAYRAEAWGAEPSGWRRRISR